VSKLTIVMTFEADQEQFIRATNALFEITPFGECIGIGAPQEQDSWGDCEAMRAEEPPP
jgi:hypothetical protein